MPSNPIVPLSLEATAGAVGIFLWGLAIIGFWLGVFYGIAKRSGRAVVWGFWWPFVLFGVYMLVAATVQPAPDGYSLFLLVWFALCAVWPFWRLYSRYNES